MAISIDNKKNMEIKEILKTIDPKEFDGHTEFPNLTLEQKLIWIMQISLFVFEICNSFFKDQNLY
ncbi:MAG: hypothetical protein KatS3mg129_1280 [Leptospiraceae bacterium]|nr:MAG: hypothetical protein KatS3mg129_1280 [Leptospiraceae bacterium]